MISTNTLKYILDKLSSSLLKKSLPHFKITPKPPRFNFTTVRTPLDEEVFGKTPEQIHEETRRQQQERLAKEKREAASDQNKQPDQFSQKVEKDAQNLDEQIKNKPPTGKIYADTLSKKEGHDEFKEKVESDANRLEVYLSLQKLHTHRSGKHFVDVTSKSEWNDIVEKSMKPVIVDFYQTNCGNCKRLLPKLIDKYLSSPEEWLLVGADIEKLKDIAKDFRVENVPTVLLIHQGKIIDKLTNEDGLEVMVTTVEQLSNANE